MANDLPVERWPTSARTLIESATAGDPDSLQLKILQESMRASERERVEQLWLPRLYRKIPRERRPEPWRQVRAEYTKRWYESTGASPECDGDRDPSRAEPGGLIPDLDAIRCIVFGWADGIDPEELRFWVTRWRDEPEPAMQWLDPVTNSSASGPLHYAYVTEEFPAMRARIAQIIDSWPDSPLAVQGLLKDFGPTVELLRRVQEQTVPDSAKDALYDQGKGFPNALAAIALGDELAALHRLADRAARLADLLDDARRSLEEMGWQISADGKLQEARPTTTGPKPPYLVKVIWGLYTYLRPFYRRTFEDDQLNPERLRDQISRLLSPYFLRAETSPERGGPVWRVINNHSYSS